MRKIGILQSNYIPWKGVFDIINQVDVFVFLEDVQYTVRDWRNRNKILTKTGTQWITVPTIHKDNRHQMICETKINNIEPWQRKHFAAFQSNYARAPYYKKYKWILDELYIKSVWDKISELNIYATILISNELGIKTKFINSIDLKTTGSKDDKLIQIIKKLDGDYYLSGPAAQNYINPHKFKSADIKLEYIKYEYPKYKQLYEPFYHNVTILDLLFNCGPDAPYYIWGWRKDRNKGEIEYDIL